LPFGEACYLAFKSTVAQQLVFAEVVWLTLRMGGAKKT